MSAFLKVDNLEKYYGSAENITKAIDRISFEINEGEFVGIMGESGSGKTSLLNILGTVDTATSGHVFFEGKDISKMSKDERADFRKQNLGFVFQNFNLLDMLTIQENIYIPLLLTKNQGTDVMKKTEKIMEILNIKEIADKYPHQVSGGQQQRVLLARALCAAQKILLLDEPVSGLDPRVTAEMYQLIKDLNKKDGITIIMISHDIAAAVKYATHILHIGEHCFFGTKKQYLQSSLGKAFTGQEGEDE